MPITPTPKIWMNGDLVDWDNARIHVGTHTLHYGTGVFEGIRAYETSQGPAVFRLTDHIVRLHNSAKILGMSIPYTVDELVEATKATVASTGLPACYVRPIAYYGYGEMGLNTMPCSVDVAIMCWPWGAYLGDDALVEGRAPEDLVVDPSRPQHHAAGGEDHRQLRELVARQGRGAQGRLRRGDHARRQRPRRRVLGRERVRVAQRQADHAAAVGGRARGHHPEHGDHPRPRPRLRGGAATTSPAATSTSPTRCSSSAPRRRSRRSTRSTTAPIPCPGPKTQAIADLYGRVVRGQEDQYKDWCELAV